MNLISMGELPPERIMAILDLAATYAKGRHEDVLADAIVCTAFYEPSTRTRLSFETAAHRLGARVIGFSDAHATSTAKGESLEDTARVLAGFADAVIVRHPETGSARRMADAVDVPVINAGDGSGEHPTQTLVDLYTIRQAFGAIEGRSVAVVGDLRYGRTVHSLVPALQRLGADVVAVPAPGLGLPELGLEETDLDTALRRCDVVYATRVQRERLPRPDAHADAEAAVRIDRARLERAGFDGILLHPLPRRDELAKDVDDHAAAKYFEQARNGVPVRMAVLATTLGATS